MDPVMTWGLILLGMFIGASFGFMLGSFLTRIKIDDERENARWLAERIEKGWSDR